MRYRITLILSCLVLVLAMSTSAQAEFKRNYTLAKKSFEDGDYSEAIEKLKDAINDNPDSAARVKLYGMRYDSYTPHYFLGEAYFKLNDCSSAMAAWGKALEAGVVQNLDIFSSMQANMGNCKVDAIDVSGIAAEAGSEIDGLDTAISSYAKLQNESQLRSEWSSKWQPELNQSQQLAQTLRQRLTIATDESDPDAIKAIASEAKRAVSALNGSERLALAQVKAIQEKGVEAERLARDEARENLLNVIGSAKGAERHEGSNAQMQSLLADLERQVSTGEALGATASSVNIKEQTQIIGNVLRRYNLSVQDWQAQQQSIADRIPPAELKSLAESYFSGNYQNVADSASPDGFSKNRAKIQALLFRAAANHKLYVRSGQENPGALRQAENDIRAIKQIDRRFSPYIAAFSPSFLALFQQTS